MFLWRLITKCSTINLQEIPQLECDYYCKNMVIFFVKGTPSLKHVSSFKKTWFYYSKNMTINAPKTGLLHF